MSDARSPLLTATDGETVASRLSDLPLFSGMPEDDLADVASAFERTDVVSALLAPATSARRRSRPRSSTI